MDKTLGVGVGLYLYKDDLADDKKFQEMLANLWKAKKSPDGLAELNWMGIKMNGNASSLVAAGVATALADLRLQLPQVQAAPAVQGPRIEA